MKDIFGLGSHVRVRAYDLEEYVGKSGTVVGYDFSEELPLICVAFDTLPRDAFYEDEITHDFTWTGALA